MQTKPEEKVEEVVETEVEFKPRESPWKRNLRYMGYARVAVFFVIAVVILYAISKPSPVYEPVAIETPATQTQMVTDEVVSQPISEAISTQVSALPSPTIVVVAESVPALLEKSKWIRIVGVAYVSVGEVCYDNSQTQWMIYSKTGEYHTCSESEKNSQDVVDLSGIEVIPTAIAVVSKAYLPDSTLPEGEFWISVDSLAEHELPEGYKRVCQLTSIENASDGHPDQTITVLAENQVLGGYAGFCYQVKDDEVKKTVVGMMSNVFRLVEADPQAKIFLLGIDWVGGDWFGKYDYTVVN